ncbi:MAG: TonB-dependent receptor [candidate division KSB1 bacterium]|nr:TonB-dependent receptor [candidate division KSB1 bacterium]MDZ7304527.1 TonB-dependent receptor [candidate division KSB1 bacterium]MDZ7314429.1 TonB-dependent receptor [candidate division KSB1 bacterium]
MRPYLILLLVCLIPAGTFGQNKPAFIAGKILDEKGKPLAFANVQVLETYDGDVSNEFGKFVLMTRKTGEVKVRASLIGYEANEQTVHLISGDTARVSFVLLEKVVDLQEVIVTAGAFATGDEGKGVTLRRMEVVTTPGAAADIFLAIKTFPGVAMVDEGSGLFVRGGDVSETVTLLDQATVVHPYKYESPTGGVFGTINPFLVSGTFFSSGGFSARYGNALSGILAMESLNLPQGSAYNLNLGLAAASIGLQIPLIQNKLGVRFSGNYSFTDIMFRLNGRRDEFTRTPRGSDGNLSLIYQYSPTGRLKFFNFAANDRLGVHVNQPSFEAVYRGDEINQLHNLQWTDLWRGWLLKMSLSLNRYDTQRRLGNLNLDQRDDTCKWRLDVERELGKRARLAWGGEIERVQNKFGGTVPVNRDVLDPHANVYRLNENYSAQRWGAYTEIEAQLARRWTGGAGVRIDHHDLAEEMKVDPRLSLRHDFSKRTNIRLAWGIYHQFPEAYLFNPASGNPRLASQKAQHYILGIEHQRDQLMLRIEAYYKPYSHLVIRDKERHYANRGNGKAGGIDLFVKYGAFLQTRCDGWMAYSFLHSRRLLPRNLSDSYLYERSPSPFDITHNLTLVGKVRVIQFFLAGLTFRYATGRPVTPIIGATRNTQYGFYEPIEGPVNSERLPSFQRLDGTLSYYLPYGNGHSATFYLAVSNLLNRANVLDYDYSLDYSSRMPRTTNYRRFIYFGITTTLTM